MKGKVFLIIFALPFFGVGVWMLYSVSSNMIDAWRMQGWEVAEAALSQGGYETHSGDDSDTYKAYARYSYQFRGSAYTNNRVSIAGGADNVGDYQATLGRRLGTALSRGDSIEIYVNPDDPQDSVIDRKLRWGMVGFKSMTPSCAK